MPQYSLTLYVIGDGQRARRAKLDTARLMDALSGAGHNLNVVDLLADGAAVEPQSGVLTPQLVRTAPAPGAEVIGDLSDIQSVAEALGLRLANTPAETSPYASSYRTWYAS